MSGMKSRYCMVVGQKRDQDLELRLRVSFSSAAKLKRMADKSGEIGVNEEAFLQMLEGGEIIHGEPMTLSVEQVQSESVLDEAHRIIYGDREKAYGNPRFNLDSIAQFWSVYLSRKYPHLRASFQAGPHIRITAEDVAQLMVLLKSARLIHNPTHRDSLVDQAGYAALQDRIQGIMAE